MLNAFGYAISWFWIDEAKKQQKKHILFQKVSYN